MTKAVEKEKILLVDDSPNSVEVVGRLLSREGYRVTKLLSAKDAIETLKNTAFDLVITDYKMPLVSGMELLGHVRDNYPDTEVMIVTGYATVEGAVEAVKMGADDYLSKPFTDDELLAAVSRSLDKLNSRRAARSRSLSTPRTPQGFIGESEPMLQVYRKVAKAARTKATVLVTGESGTGKELVARAIHYSSDRAASPFVAVNCGGIPESLLESELFGHLKGSFTGATETRAGFFQTADGGTIFLDEVTETSVQTQVKLLRVLQEKEICMIGSARPQKVDVRIVAATNKNPLQLVEKGALRDDLYYRLNVIEVSLPPLFARGDDILVLISHFAEKYAAEAASPKVEFTEAALNALRKYHWPGNVRELENVIQRILVMADSATVDVPDLPELMRFPRRPRPEGLGRTLQEVELAHIRAVLASVQDNKTQAAQILGIDRKTLREKLKKLTED